MEALTKSMQYINGDPLILPYSVIPNQILNRQNYAGGQIKRDSEFGKVIYNIASDMNYKVYLDIGTWCGLGTTKCFLDSIILRNDDAQLIALETNKQFYTITKKYWDKYFEHYNIDNIDNKKFKLINGSIIKYTDLDEKYITDSGHNKYTYDYNEDIKEAPHIILDTNIDVVCLDGGHFSSLLEWNFLKNNLKVIILDDVKTSKTREIFQEIQDSDLWKIIYQSNNRGGELVAIKKR